MDNLTHHIPKTRVCERTKKVITKLAYEDRREISEFIRLVLDRVAEEFEGKPFDKNLLYSSKK